MSNYKPPLGDNTNSQAGNVILVAFMAFAAFVMISKLIG